MWKSYTSWPQLVQSSFPNGRQAAKPHSVSARTCYGSLTYEWKIFDLYTNLFVRPKLALVSRLHFFETTFLSISTQSLHHYRDWPRLCGITAQELRCYPTSFPQDVLWPSADVLLLVRQCRSSISANVYTFDKHEFSRRRQFSLPIRRLN